MRYSKTTFTEGERKKDASKGYAMPDGSYPIENTEDLHHAIEAFGRAKDPEAVKKHIKTRARELGKESMLPEDWGKSSKAFDQLAHSLSIKANNITKNLPLSKAHGPSGNAVNHSARGDNESAQAAHGLASIHHKNLEEHEAADAHSAAALAHSDVIDRESKSIDIFSSYKQLMSVLPPKPYIKSTTKKDIVVETKADKEGLEGLAEEKFHSPHGAMIRSLIAHKASMESDKPSRLSKDALEAAKDGMNNFASRLHRAASVHHAKQARDAGNFIERGAHEHAAQAHDTAADHHIAAHLRLGKPLELTDYSEYEEKAIIQQLDDYYDQRFTKADEDETWISDKIAKIMKEGITLRNGKHKKVTDNKQAAAIAYSMKERGKKAYDGDSHEKTVNAYHKTIESPYGRDMDEHAHDTLRHSHEGRNVAAALGHSQMYHDHSKAADVIKEAEIAEHHKHAAMEHKEAALAHLGQAILSLAGKCDKKYSENHTVEPPLHHNEDM